MPRENRKRGRKIKAKHPEQTQKDDGYSHDFYHEDTSKDFPDQVCEGNSENAPFGTLDPDVKAYFRRVDDQLRDWQERTVIEADVEPNEERRMFLTAALSEMSGKELQLATDPDCSPVLERMLYSMDDFVRRVFIDRLAGSWLQLITNRFASHVCQTLFVVGLETIHRETCGILPAHSMSDDSRGELLTMTQLILNMCEDIIPELPRLIQNVFASHVLRSLLILLAPSQLARSQSHPHRHMPSARSKKSTSWKARCGPMKAVITDDLKEGSSNLAEDGALRTPESFIGMVGRFIERIQTKLDGNEIRALAVDKVASPSLQMFLELEATLGKAGASGSIMDHVLVNFVTETLSGITPPASLYVHKLIRDRTSSHLLETIFSCCHDDVFDRLWDCYIRDDLPSLSTHPVANFVVARGVAKLNEQELGHAAIRLESTWSSALKSSCMGVLVAMIDRAAQIGAHEARLVEAVCSMVQANTDEERKTLLSCLLQLKSSTEYQATLIGTDDIKTGTKDKTPSEPKVQGSILLQSMLRLHEPHNHIILDSLYSLPPETLLALAQNATSSRIFDAAFESATVPLRSRKRLVTAFIGHFHLLVDDRIGSRVADRSWETADPYLKEKIARSLIPYEQFLARSHFGRYFSRNLNLPLLQRMPDQWRYQQSRNGKFPKNGGIVSATRTMPLHSSVGKVEGGSGYDLPSPDQKHGSKRKRQDATRGHEIDVLFSRINVKKRAKGIATTSTEPNMTGVKQDAALDAVLGAIKAVSGSHEIKRKAE